MTTRYNRAEHFAAAWLELLDALPNVDQVRITWRRRNGQWLCQIPLSRSQLISGTGISEAEAMRSAAAALARL